MAFVTGDRNVAETIAKGPDRLDAGAVRDFEHRLPAASLLSNERLVVDLSLTSFITSMALRSLLTAARRLDKEDERLVVCVSSPEDIRLFTASGLDQVIPVRKTLDQAREPHATPVERHERSILLPCDNVSPAVIRDASETPPRRPRR